jgi:uncharacterized membrane protein
LLLVPPLQQAWDFMCHAGSSIGGLHGIFSCCCRLVHSATAAAATAAAGRPAKWLLSGCSFCIVSFSLIQKLIHIGSQLLLLMAVLLAAWLLILLWP